MIFPAVKDLPEKMKELRMALGFSAEAAVKADYETLAAARLVSGSGMVDIAPLFPRIMVEKEDACNKKQPKAAKQEKAPAPAAEKKAKEEEMPAGMISVDDFFKTELKTAEVLEAEKVENSDKLLRMQIKVGEEVRQIVSGIAQYYTPEEMVGKTIVIVANLKPAKIRGVVSNGMLLAAKDGDTLKLVTIEGGSFKSGIPVG
jgi:methionyl-tRNA synthetase